MAGYLLRRLLAAFVVVWAAATALFVLIRLSGNPAAILIDPTATREQYEALLKYYGLDQPVHIQYITFLTQLLQGDLGQSFLHNQPTVDLLLGRFPATAQLAFSALFLAVVIAVPVGILSAVRRNSWLDYGAAAFATVAQSMPNYWLGVVLILFFAVEFRLLPTSGQGGLQHLVLPAVTLALGPMAKYLRLTRSEMLGVLQQDYIRTARAKGVTERQIEFRHALRNSSIPLVTIIGTDISSLLGGAIIVETVFSWPGIGSLLMNAVSHRDYPMVQATVLAITVIVVVTNLLVDILYGYLDPRIRLT